MFSQPQAIAEHTLVVNKFPFAQRKPENLLLLNFFLVARPYLPSVAEVYDIHVGLLDVPVQILRAVLLLQVNRKGQLLVLPGGLQRSKRPLTLWLEHYRSI